MNFARQKRNFWTPKRIKQNKTRIAIGKAFPWMESTETEGRFLANVLGQGCSVICKIFRAVRCLFFTWAMDFFALVQTKVFLKFRFSINLELYYLSNVQAFICVMNKWHKIAKCLGVRIQTRHTGSDPEFCHRNAGKPGFGCSPLLPSWDGEEVDQPVRFEGVGGTAGGTFRENRAARS